MKLAIKSVPPFSQPFSTNRFADHGYEAITVEAELAFPAPFT